MPGIFSPENTHYVHFKCLHEGSKTHLDANYLKTITKIFENEKGYHQSYVDAQIKGVTAEFVGTKVLERAGYEIRETKLPGNKGIDIVAVKYNNHGQVADIIASEAKYRAQGVPDLGEQMGDKWLRGNIKKMISSTDPEVKATGVLLEENKHLIRRKANLLDSTGANSWNRIKLPPSGDFK